MRWGLIPPWSKEAKPRYATFNARAETVARSPAFRGAWKAGRHCLVVTDGFYEWRRSDKQPFAIGRHDGRLTAMAGLWETWRSPEGETIPSCTVITTDANDLMRPLHERMPVVLAEEAWPVWLGEAAADAKELAGLLAPYRHDDLVAWRVHRRVGNVRNNDAALVEPVGDSCEQNGSSTTSPGALTN